ncbi:MAG: hypothetical protein OXG25_03505 [Gammaproteobacteria bacterium]|nr:hypothetical protein [Gammaproteobacteria bacterium]
MIVDLERRVTKHVLRELSSRAKVLLSVVCMQQFVMLRLDAIYTWLYRYRNCRCLRTVEGDEKQIETPNVCTCNKPIGSPYHARRSLAIRDAMAIMR